MIILLLFSRILEMMTFSLDRVIELLAILGALLIPLQIMHVLTRKLVSQLQRNKLWLIFASIGTPVHEFSHATAALLLGHKIEKIKLFDPQPDGGLGYVIHSHRYGLLGKLTTAIIAIAPIIGGYLTFILATALLNPEPLNSLVSMTLNDVKNLGSSIASAYAAIWESLGWSWMSFVWVFITTSLFACMMPSKADYTSAFPGIITLIALLIALSGLSFEAHSMIQTLSIGLINIALPALSIAICFLVLMTLLLGGIRIIFKTKQQYASNP